MAQPFVGCPQKTETTRLRDLGLDIELVQDFSINQMEMQMVSLGL
jgi:hypothetical protein